MRHLILLMIVVVCGVASADVLRPLGDPADIPADVDKFVEHSADNAGQYTIKVKPHGDGAIRVPVTVATAAAVSSDQFMVDGSSAFVPERLGKSISTGPRLMDHRAESRLPNRMSRR